MYAKATKLTTLSFLLASSHMILGQDTSTSNRAAGSTRMREVAARTMVTQGALGSATRKPARTFSGNIEQSLAQAEKGTPTLPVAHKPSGATANMVTIRSSRQAQFVIQNGSSPKPKMQTETAHVAEPWAELTSPSYGATLQPVQTFTWTAGTGVTEYYLWIGSCYDCNDLLFQDEGLNQTQTVALPVDGRRIYVTLFSYIQGSWFYWQYEFQEGTGRPVRVFVDNELGYALNVYINGNVVGSVSAFNTQYADATVTSLTVSFELIQPTLNGTALGDSMSGYFQRIDNPSGDYTFTVNNQIGNDFYMLPEISNNTATALEIDVNAGLVAENKCYCSAPAYTQNVVAGYYQLFSNSNVRLYIAGQNYTGPYEFYGEDSNGEIGVSGLLYKLAQENSGIVHLDANFVP